MTFAPLDVLVIAAHPDDAEIGAGAAILASKAQGARVGVLDLTSGEPTPHGSLEIRARETAAATAVLGLDWRGNLGLPNRALVADLDARRKVAVALRELRPRLVVTHYWDDAHPDHVAACSLVEAARFWAKLTKTDMPGDPHYPEKIVYFYSLHLRLHASPSFVLDASPHFEKKLAALDCYRSQFVAGRKAPVTDTVRTVAAYWGWTIGAAFGEPFRTREEVGVSSLLDVR